MKTKDQLNEEFEIVWSRNEERLQRAAAHRLYGHPHEIEEAISRTKLSLYEKMNDETEIRLPDQYVMGILNNIIKKIYAEIKRNKEKLVSIEEDEKESHVLAVGYDYEQEIFEKHIDDSAIDAFKEDFLSQLSEKDRMVIKLHYEDNLSYRDIAEKMGVSVLAVKQRSYRVWKKAKKYAEEKF
ncbi:MAG: sigma-70 family RNA polymerase sigma factor [Clostridia bacterium]|nr:sigma-70 family RNA polymerase sigma factor [Clostridia bacterium]